jgi:hypothetical protein
LFISIYSSWIANYAWRGGLGHSSHSGTGVEKSEAKIEQSWQVQISALAAFYDFFIFLASPPLQ